MTVPAGGFWRSTMPALASSLYCLSHVSGDEARLGDYGVGVRLAQP